MSEKDKLVSRVLTLAGEVGLSGITPVELSDSATLVIHLSPYPVVARIATVLSEEHENVVFTILERELQVARHLCARGVPVIMPTDVVDPGPHDIGGTWITFWTYVSRVDLPRLSTEEAVGMVNDLSAAMKEYPGELPVLGIWERTRRSAARLKSNPDSRVQILLEIFARVDERIRREPKTLVPCHGDAHIGNLYPGTEGPLWTDFEDVSLMPDYWDLASFVCIPALFKGTEEPTLRYVLDLIHDKGNVKAFGSMLIARTLMSTLGNLDYALAGNGDLDFAEKELDLAEDFIHRIESMTGIR